MTGKVEKKVVKKKSPPSSAGASYENLLVPNSRSNSPPLPLVFEELLKWDADEFLLDAAAVRESLERLKPRIREWDSDPETADRLLLMLARLAVRPSEEKLKWSHAALIYSFVDGYERGEVPPFVQEFLYHAFVAVLEGAPFDLAITLPGREISKEWVSMSPSQRAQEEAAQLMELLTKPIFKQELKRLYPEEPQEEAAKIAIAKTFSRSTPWVRNARTDARNKNPEKRTKSGLTT